MTSDTDDSAPNQDIARATARLAALVGVQHAEFDTDRLARTLGSTAPSHLPLGVICPGSEDEVVAIVKEAGASGIPLYPISRGRNWGYGDAAPPAAGQVIVDLGRMNRIIHIDDRLAYATIEPGVTQGQLADALAARGSRLWLDATGAGPEASIVGNVLERGFGHTAYGDRVRSISGLNVVLGDGSLLQTGFSGVSTSAVGAVFPYGAGPWMDGLFTQSALGIVTRMTVWLMPAPSYFCAVIGQLERSADILELIERLRPLRMDNTLESVVHVGNDLRLISGRIGYPWDRAQGKTPLPPDLRAALCRELDVSAWTFSAALYGDRARVRAAGRRVKKALKGLGCKLHFVDERKLALGRLAASLTGFMGMGQKLADRLDQIEPALGLLKGRPTESFLRGAYWRTRRIINPDQRLDPGRDGCGLLWLAPVLPATGADLERLSAITEPVFAEYGFDYLVTVSFVTGRSLSAVMTIAFDRDDPTDCARAEACYRSLVDLTEAAGYPIYRGHSQMMDCVVREGNGYWDAGARIKTALDPKGIIAPGRYGA